MKIIILLVCSFMSISLFAQQGARGVVLDAQTKQPIQDVSLFITAFQIQVKHFHLST